MKCKVCSRRDRSDIDRRLLDPRTSVSSLAKEVGLDRGTLGRHQRSHLARKLSTSIENARAEMELNEIAQVGSDLQQLWAATRNDWESARERGDWTLAIKAVRELTRMYELQARLVMEASAGRASDVANHPVWLELSSLITGALMPYPEARAAVMDAITRRLGRSLPA